jgi:hypothetical protein
MRRQNGREAECWGGVLSYIVRRNGGSRMVTTVVVVSV